MRDYKEFLFQAVLSNFASVPSYASLMLKPTNTGKRRDPYVICLYRLQKSEAELWDLVQRTRLTK